MNGARLVSLTIALTDIRGMVRAMLRRMHKQNPEGPNEEDMEALDIIADEALRRAAMARREA